MLVTPKVTRRAFARNTLGTLSLAAATGMRASDDFTAHIDRVLNDGIRTRKIPAVAAMVADAHRVLYQGAFGKRDGTTITPVAVDSIFAIASMTKAVTSVAAMQLVEQGAVTLDEPISRILPELATFPVLDGFDKMNKPILRRARTPITLRHMLSHTSGLAYNVWSAPLTKLDSVGGTSAGTLMFEPGTNWQYGYGPEWTGRLIERISKLTLEQYFERNVTSPLEMKDTGFSISAAKYPRMASTFMRTTSGPTKGVLFEMTRKLPPPPPTFDGGGGLYSTVGDFTKFMQMILRRGRSNTNGLMLQKDTADAMSMNQIGELSAGKLKSQRPEVASDTDFHPGVIDKFGLGFLITAEDVANGRSAGSLAWAGIDNTFFWIDPARGLCATIMMQFLPFCDKEAVGLLSDFEQAIYAAS